MASVDWERAWLALKAEIVKKPSHGKRDLLVAMGEIEVASTVPEGQDGYDPRPTNGEARGHRASTAVS